MDDDTERAEANKELGQGDDPGGAASQQPDALPVHPDEEESSTVDDRATAEGDERTTPSPRVPDTAEQITVEKSIAEVTPTAPPVTEVVEVSDDVIDDDDADDNPVGEDNGGPGPLTFLERLDAGMERIFPRDD